jgi:hypothetical protein
MRFSKISGLFMAIAIALSACGQGGSGVSKTPETADYGEWYRSALEQPEKGNIYGMCYLAYEGVRNGIDYKKALKLMDNLGVQSIRHWIHFGYIMSDPTTFKEEETALMHDILAEAALYDFQIIGMSHTNWSVEEQRFVIGKPTRQAWEGSEYMQWLEAYEESWYTLVREFPEITIWEIDNEINNKDFMYIQGKFGEKLPTEELAAMSADMLFYASRGIHRANPDAVTVMGGIVDPIGLGIPETDTGTTMVNFMEALYDAIDSGEHGSYYYDDFFQVAAWHPYYYKGSPDEYFVEQNNAVYEVIRRREGKEKKVYLTEFGWNERHYDMDSMVSAIEKLYECVEREMPYVESLHYFRDFDNVNNNMETAGLFYDPNPARTDIIPHTDRRGTPGAPKASAYAYQRATGGSGSLELLMTPIE